MELGVRFDTVSPILKEQFAHAMDFWAGVLDMDWHPDNTSNCAIRVTEGPPENFALDDIAQADSLEMDTFGGEVSFNPAASMESSELYLISIHEIGHLFGLEHNPSAMSVMYYLEIEGPQRLDETDIAALGVHHKLRDIRKTRYDLFLPSDLRAPFRPTSWRRTKARCFELLQGES
ncbi:MAG: matrixin family metalloprotease [Bryobacteraceae bacterium]